MLIGTGILNWPRFERITDRYGSVNLSLPVIGNEERVQFDDNLVGQRGTLVATILETRKSSHIGDFFSRHSPSTPKVGDKFELGQGTIFLGEYDTIGVKPDGGRKTNWLDPKALYQCHSQTVELHFEPE